MLNEQRLPQYETLKSAAAEERLVLMHALRRRDRNRVALVCRRRDQCGTVAIAPLAEIFERDAAHDYLPPAVDGGFDDEPRLR